MNRGTLAETDESIVRASTGSSEGSRRYPRFTPGTGDVRCTHVHFPPETAAAGLAVQRTSVQART